LSTLSPMHDVRGVPRDSRGEFTPADDSDGEEDGSKPSIKMDLAKKLIDDDEEDEAESAATSASWVGRKVDAIFSPVLNFLQGATANDSSAEGEDREGVGALTRTEDSDDSEVVTDAVANTNSFGLSKELSKESDAAPPATEKEPPGGQAADDGDAVMTDYDSPESVAKKPHGDMPSDVYTSCERDDTINIATVVAANDASETNYYVDGEEDDEEEEFNPYLFIKCLPPYQYAIPPGWTSRPKVLPPVDRAVLPPTPPICLVLDLDETLVHCTVEPVPDADMTFPVEFNGVEYRVHVRTRPYLKEFLEAVAQKFEVVIFTASQKVYADELLDRIDPDRRLIRHRVFRDSCLPVEGNFLKDLTVLGRDLTGTVLVDNSPHAFGYQVDNGIPIESWFDDPHDRELLKLEAFLRTLHGAEDVRDVVRRTFRTRQLVLGA